MLNNELKFSFDDVIPTKEQIIKYASLATIIKEDDVTFTKEVNDNFEKLLSELIPLGYNPEAISEIIEALIMVKIFNTAQEVVELEMDNED